MGISGSAGDRHGAAGAQCEPAPLRRLADDPSGSDDRPRPHPHRRHPDIGGELDVTSAFTVTVHFGAGPTLSGSGKLVAKPGSTGTIATPRETCNPLTLNGTTLVNEGTLTFGSSQPGRGGGTFVMENGAQLQNSGTFNDNSLGKGCNFGAASFATPAAQHPRSPTPAPSNSTAPRSALRTSRSEWPSQTRAR